MVRVEFLGPISRPPIELEATTLQEVAEFLQQDKSLVEWLPKCAIALNDSMVTSVDRTLKAGDKITLLPPVCGG